RSRAAGAARRSSRRGAKPPWAARPGPLRATLPRCNRARFAIGFRGSGGAMKKLAACVGFVVAIGVGQLRAQAPAPPAQAPRATPSPSSTYQGGMPPADISAAAVKPFIDGLPKNAITDPPIRAVDVGGYR